MTGSPRVGGAGGPGAGSPGRLVAIAPNPSIDRLFRLDRLRIGLVNRPDLELRVAGGKGLNVARAAAALGGDATAIAILAGYAGRWVADELAAAGVRGRFAWTDGETRSCIAVADAATGSLTELNEAGPTLDAEAWDRLEQVVGVELAEGGVGLVAISGSLPPGAPADGVERLVVAIRRAGVAVAVDVGGAPLRGALAARPELVKLNLLEARAAVGSAADGRVEPSPAALARALAERTGGTAVVTLGIAGAVAADPSGRLLEVDRPPVVGPYPVGSGDAFLAGFALATLAGDPLDAALRRAAGAAAASALEPGAGRLDRAEAERLAGLVAVRSPEA